MIIQCNPAMAEAARKIFQHEDIQYSYGLGPGCIALEIDKKDERRVRTIIYEWKIVLDKLHMEVNL